MSKTSKGSEYEVGYKKPPKHTQFKTGHSSNGGRPKGSLNYRTIWEREMNEKLPAVSGSKGSRLTYRVAAIKRLKVGVVSGQAPQAAVNKFFDIELRLAGAASEDLVDQGAKSSHDLTAEEWDVIARFAASKAQRFHDGGESE